VPTFVEQGYRIEWEYWLGLFAPAKTPAPEILRINAAIGKALARRDVRERLEKIVFEPAFGSPDELGNLVRSGTAFWEPVVKASGWVPQ
jgi:tripartite-type tricarboxylate transporter receptor subunit TctC